MKIIKDFEQGSAEWKAFRQCKISGTKLKDVMGTPWASLQLMSDLIAEAGTEQSKSFNPTIEMERGITEEKFAIEKFEEKTGKKVEDVGVCVHDEYEWLTLSPDGLIKDENGKYTEAVEVKSPDSKVAIMYKLINLVDDIKLTKSQQNILGVPPKYIWQVVHYFIVNQDLETLYFVVYDERFINDNSKIYIVEVSRDNEILQDMISQAETKLHEFRSTWLKYKDIVLETNF